MQGKLALALGMVLSAQAAWAADPMQRMLAKLSPEERSHQACILRGLATVHLLGADLPNVDRAARRLLTLGAEQHHAYALQCGQMLLGLSCYHRNALDDAVEWAAAVVGDRRPTAFSILRDSTILLALAYQAQGRRLEAQTVAARLAKTASAAVAIGRAAEYKAAAATAVRVQFASAFHPASSNVNAAMG